MTETHIVGEAYNLERTHIYTWYTDGTVSRIAVIKGKGGIVEFGQEESVWPPVSYTDALFCDWQPAPPNSKPVLSLDEIERRHSERHKTVKLVHPTMETMRIIQGSEVYAKLLALGYTEATEQ